MSKLRIHVLPRQTDIHGRRFFLPAIQFAVGPCGAVWFFTAPFILIEWEISK